MECTRCSAPSHNAYICSTCELTLSQDLGDIPALVAELETTRTRLDKLGGEGIGIVVRSTDEPLPWSERASQATEGLRTVLAVEMRRFDWPTGAPGDMATWLLAHVDLVRQRETAGEAVDAVGAAVSKARRAIDRAPQLGYAGPCHECKQPGEPAVHMYARFDAAFVTCKNCGARYDMASRKEWLRAEVEQAVGTAAEISRALAALFGQGVPVNTIRSWAHRGRLPMVRLNDLGQPMYSVREVMNLATKADTQKAS